MKVNSYENDLLMSGSKAITNVDNGIDSEDTHEFFGITIESKLTFENCFNRLC